MVDREMLQAIEELLDRKLEEKLEEKLEKKFDEKLSPIYRRLDGIERSVVSVMEKQTALQMVIEHDIRADIRMLDEKTNRMLQTLGDLVKESGTIQNHEIRINKLESDMRETQYRMEKAGVAF